VEQCNSVWCDSSSPKNEDSEGLVSSIEQKELGELGMI